MFVFSKLLHLVDLVDRYFIRVSSIITTSVHILLIGKDKIENLLLEYINNLLHTLPSLYLNLDSNLLQHLELSRRSNIRRTIKTWNESSCTTCFPTLQMC